MCQHYESLLNKELDELTTLNTAEWKNAFQVAARWISRDLPRVTQVTTDHGFTVILEKLEQQPQSQQAQSITTIAPAKTDKIIHLKSINKVIKAARMSHNKYNNKNAKKIIYYYNDTKT